MKQIQIIDREIDTKTKCNFNDKYLLNKKQLKSMGEKYKQKLDKQIQCKDKVICRKTTCNFDNKYIYNIGNFKAWIKK